MDTIFALTYATLSMGHFEIKLYNVCTFNYGEFLAEYIKENWNRFLDDCYTVLRSSQISPEELLLTLNSINPSIQFTMEYSRDQILFLDILIKRNENGIWMDLYHKSRDTQRCPFNTKNLKSHQMKTSCNSLQHLIPITLIFRVLLNPRLIV